MLPPKNIVFLLGGHDLEMHEIQRLVEGSFCKVFDAGLDWSNAELDAYLDVLKHNVGSHFVGIELRDPNNLSLKYDYTLIDHHNEFSDRPASIIQVADMLGVTPDRRLSLVAANDSGYIPAMLAMGATNDEIQEIRRKDRAAQGVTEEDESLAVESISEGLTETNGVFIVHSLTTHFSAICDRLYPYRRLLIYTDREWAYYGEGKSQLVDYFAADIEAGRVYHGGGENGFIGAARDAFAKEQIDSFVNHFYEHL